MSDASDLLAAAGSAGVGAFAGILATPKVYALQGTSAGTLEPTLDLGDGSTAELMTMGSIYVELVSVGTDAQFQPQLLGQQ